MRLGELIDVLTQTDSFLTEYKLSGLYRELIKALNEARRKPSPETAARINRLRERISNAHDMAGETRWNNSCRIIHERLGTADLIGKDAASKIDRVFQEHETDPGGAAQALDQIAEQTRDLEERVRALVTGLGPLTEENRGAPSDRTTVQLYFGENVAVHTLKDLQDVLETWDRVIASFSKLTRESEEDVKIINIEHNPLNIELAVLYVIAAAIGGATCEIMRIHERYLNIKRIELEVDALDLSDPSVTRQLKKEANNLVSNTAADVTRNLIEEFDWANNKNRVDIQGHIKSAVTTIFEFVRDGGRIDVRGGNDSELEIHQRLTEAFSRVRGMELRIQQLDQETGAKVTEPED
ncbi:MAG: hypothetical protein R6U89_00715 [Dehalococcoidia bacterium]